MNRSSANREDGERDENEMVMPVGVGAAEVLNAADEVEAGEYVYEYDDATDECTSMPYDMGDDRAAEVRLRLARRGLSMDTDDRGWLVREAVAS